MRPSSHFRTTLDRLAIALSLALIIILVIALGIYGKKLSYHWFYEDEVKATIMEMVKQEALK